MIEPTNVSYKYGCSECSSKKGMPEYISIPNHQYGDYVVLRPDAASCQRLKQLGLQIQDVFHSQNLDHLGASISDPEHMHLTLAMPLSPMNKTQARNLINYALAGATGPLNFNVIFRSPSTGGNNSFTFSSMNYAPSFNILLNKNDVAFQNFNSNSTHNLMTNLATKIQTYCQEYNLVDTAKNASGECNKFHPHITLGKIDEDRAKILHDRYEHRNEDQQALSHLASTTAAKYFKQKHGIEVLPLTFDKIEILRCDKMKGQSDNKTTVLESFDLKTNQWAEGEFPTCMHINHNDNQSKMMELLSYVNEVNHDSNYNNKSYPEIFHLDFENHPLSDNDLIYITRVGDQSTLKELNLRNTNITDVGLQFLLDSHPHLEHLDVRGTQVSLQSLKLLNQTHVKIQSDLHPTLDAIARRISNLLKLETSTTVNWSRDQDKNGDLLNIGFQDVTHAQALFAKVAGGQGSVYSKNGLHHVRLGPLRMKALFGADGDRILKEALKEIN